MRAGPCRIEGPRLKDVDDWLGQYRQLWDERFDRIEDYLRDLQKGGTDDRGN